ncbi:MAG TPA: alpha-amylase, partial [Bacteroidota bacterium]|nr:alpha-amylase [Bacteroidota bacterium]
LSGQCYVDIPLDDLSGSSIELRDLLSDAAYTRDRNALSSKGIYFDLQPYGIHIFEVTPAS